MKLNGRLAEHYQRCFGIDLPEAPIGRFACQLATVLPPDRRARIPSAINGLPATSRIEFMSSPEKDAQFLKSNYAMRTLAGKDHQ